MVTDIIVEELEHVEPGHAYRNVVHMGQYIYYRILDEEFDLEYIS